MGVEFLEKYSTFSTGWIYLMKAVLLLTRVSFTIHHGIRVMHPMPLIMYVFILKLSTQFNQALIRTMRRLGILFKDISTSNYLQIAFIFGVHISSQIY